MDVDEVIRLISWEGKEFVVPLCAKGMIDFLEKVPELDTAISLSDMEIDTETLGIILNYCNSKGFLPSGTFGSPPTTSRCLSEFVHDQTDLDFLQEINEEQFIKVAIAAHKLDVQHLIDLCAVKIAVQFQALDEAEMTEIVKWCPKISYEEDEYMRTIESSWMNS